MNEELFARFRKCAVDVLSVDADKVTLEASFGDDLDADSLDLVELVMALEEEFNVGKIYRQRTAWRVNCAKLNS